MPRNPLTRARKKTVKRTLTPQTPGDWLLARYEQQARDRRKGLLCDGDGGPTVHIQPMITLKPDAIDYDDEDRYGDAERDWHVMTVTLDDYGDSSWRRL